MSILWGPAVPVYRAISEKDLTLLFGDLRVVQAALWLLLILAIGGFIIKNWSRIRQTFRIIDALIALPAAMAKIDEVHHEVKPNTGTSLNDSQRRTEAKVVKLVEQVSTIEEEFSKFKTASIEIDGELRKAIADIEDTIEVPHGRK